MKKILLVEDNPADVLLTRRVFAQADIDAEIVVAEDGVTALEMLAGTTEPKVSDPVLILMDINMPRKNGKDVLKEIKATTRLRHIPVVMLTTSDAREDIRESYENYASGYIVKPARLGDFMKAVETLKKFWFETVTLSSDD
ncbi:response regulator [Ponticaulis sp.]|mgnify:FL=1|uniref:response regulator n=1 Tax=Ponticaulis sp. TaxID=2020902 RepID=UPI000C6A323C|nr:response regulator [Ponticaulis sp.]MBN05339.1 hypothetical protein [Ponticaulis sp.]|tara:strand:- start:296 stop:718 length:423 start_codon:yes stop_codon:yes gene_type:complete